MLPFILTAEEYQTHGITSMAEFLVYYLKKQAHGAAKLQLGTSIANSSLTQFAEDVRRLQHPKLHKLYSIAAYLLHTDRDDRSTVLEVLDDLQALTELQGIPLVTRVLLQLKFLAYCATSCLMQRCVTAYCGLLE